MNQQAPDTRSPIPAPRWAGPVLVAAAIYNLAWGALTVIYPNWLFQLTGMEPPLYPFIWQCVGMIVGVYGIAYWAAAGNPYRHWPIVLVGMLGKLFGPMGYASGLVLGGKVPGINAVPPEFGVTLITNDFIWWIPFTALLYGTFKAHLAGDDSDRTDAESALAEFAADDNKTLAEHSGEQPVLVTFVRHTGCTFCKEALADLAAKQDELTKAGVRTAVVGMSPQADLRAWLNRYGLQEALAVSDPTRRLYRSFDLGRATFTQALGLKAWTRGLSATLKGHLVGKMVGDGFQMPGVFLIDKGKVTRAYRHESVADRPDYTELACPAPQATPTPA